MRSSVLLCLLILQSLVGWANGLKLYIGTAEKQETQSTKHYIQFILCNNYLDTTYVKRADVDILFTKLTTDASVITDGGTYYLVNNVTNIITDEERMNEVYVASGKEEFDRTLINEKKQFKQNNELPQIKVGGEAYYIIAPNKCLTIGNTSTIMIKEVLKLHDLSEQEKKDMEVYYTTKVRYHTDKEKNDRQELLITRPSEDLKKILLAGHKKKE